MSERYDQLKFHFVTSKGNRRVPIEINGCGLIGLLSFTETRIKEPDDEAPTGSYYYLDPNTLYENLTRAEVEGTYEKEVGAPLVCCKECGEIHCWSVYAVVERTGNSVVWTLRHNHRNWDYGLQFCFERKQYDSQIRYFKCHIDRIAGTSDRNL
ncbi:MAG: hypothetical protein Q4F31_05760 [Eubacteriales bacterium]|nr:hypothetical protein [Eubacteriales bacterium]